MFHFYNRKKSVLTLSLDQEAVKRVQGKWHCSRFAHGALSVCAAGRGLEDGHGGRGLPALSRGGNKESLESGPYWMWITCSLGPLSWWEGLLQASEKRPHVPSEHQALAHGVGGVCLAQTCSASWLQACEENEWKDNVRVGL